MPTAFAHRRRVAGITVVLTALLLNACAGVPPRGPRSRTALTDRVVEVALAMVGQPYVYGGESPGGFDCSGLVYYAYGQAGVRVPRTAQAQYEAVHKLYLGQLQPGDLVFFRTTGSLFVSHVGIYIGDMRFVHALNPSSPVHISRLDRPFWQRRLVGAGSLVR